MSSCIVLNIVLKPFLKKSGKDYIREKKNGSGQQTDFSHRLDNDEIQNVYN